MRRRAEEGSPATVGSTRALGVTSIVVWCMSCSRSATVSMDGWSDDIVLIEMNRRLVCSVCGSRRVTSQPNWSEMYAAWLTRHQERSTTTKAADPKAGG